MTVNKEILCGYSSLDQLYIYLSSQDRIQYLQISYATLDLLDQEAPVFSRASLLHYHDQKRSDSRRL